MGNYEVEARENKAGVRVSEYSSSGGKSRVGELRLRKGKVRAINFWFPWRVVWFIGFLGYDPCTMYFISSHVISDVYSS